MTAREFIAQIFTRPQKGVASNMRFVTLPQIDLLRKLVEQEEEYACAAGNAPSIRGGIGRSFTWLPEGRDKYVVTEGPGGKRNTITRLANLGTVGAGRLF